MGYDIEGGLDGAAQGAAMGTLAAGPAGAPVGAALGLIAGGILGAKKKKEAKKAEKKRRQLEAMNTLLAAAQGQAGRVDPGVINMPSGDPQAALQSGVQAAQIYAGAKQAKQNYDWSKDEKNPENILRKAQAAKMTEEAEYLKRNRPKAGSDSRPFGGAFDDLG